ncbi:DUF4822 domain-containing protein [Chitinophaga deserti]|uniref:DUF4822 domain-containing protein n=1 Tax=Chitinophaga deserti TaxID=2164099 RepID=UPI000D6C046D|nr:DUF4822 domain-containing protein [Chitinophaga deserti]
MHPRLRTFTFAAFATIALASCSKDDAPAPEPQPDGNEILSSTRWITTVVTDSVGKDVTAANMGFVGLADYLPNGNYVFFNTDGTPRGDEGYYFITPDNSKRILVSRTRNYTRVVDVVKLTKEIFTYRVVNGTGATVNVEHKPVK